jgi:hypothetical protein
MPAAICQKFDLAYFSTPKACSTSMKKVLYELEQDRPCAQGYKFLHRQFPTFPITPADFEAARAYWCFTILRDPVSRLMSAYGNRVQHHNDIQNYVERSYESRTKFRLRYPFLNLHPSANEFYENLAFYQSICYSIWHHTVSVSQFLGSDLTFFDAIYKIKDIPELAQELSRRTGRTINLPHEQTEGQKVTLGMLSPKARANVLAYTRPDYELLRDFFQPPES